ncbi:MAG: sigma-54 dependent transcriptional regulator [Pseudobdellovibrio sp.]|nr:sigma-54 dependent transcriptional regulator [Pseudobdellovibrio sp.]
MKTINSTGRLAVVEDDQDMSEVIEAFFKPRGFDVTTFSTPLEALATVKKNQENFDVIITDLMMPELSGIEFTQRLHEEEIDIPVILVTGHNEVDLAVQTVEVGAYDFILKPIPFPNLLTSVQRAMHYRKVSGENKVLKAVIQNKEGTGLNGIIGKSAGFKQALDLAKKVASSQAHVLITGESGTGKEVIAKAVHSMGSRCKEAFVTINCSAIPETLLESELFGHAKGSFTGAVDKKVGLFEEAEGGTLFLDEIGDMSLPLQAKLLRVLQEKKIRRIGENQQRGIDVRIVAATHKDLRIEVQERRFREDLYFRLNVIPIRIPPLRQRKEDILPLAEFFLKKYSALNGIPLTGFSREATENLLNNPWRGNVRELENTVERAVVLATGGLIEPKDLVDFEKANSEEVVETTVPAVAATPKLTTEMTLEKIVMNERTLKLEELCQIYILKVLRKNNESKEKTAKELGIDRKTLYRKLAAMQKAEQTMMPQ